MSWVDRIEQVSSSLFIAGCSAVGGGVVWMLRAIFTNQKKLEMMEREFQMRDDRREDDRKVLDELRKDVRELRSDVRNLNPPR